MIQKFCKNSRICILILPIIISIIIICLSGYAVKISNDILLDKSNFYNYSDENKKDIIFSQNKNLFFNNSLCEFISQISVKYSNKIVTVCMYNKHIRVDIREFYSNTPSIKGIWFSINEWIEFCKMMYDINKIVNFQQVYKLQRENSTDEM
jgi:hypothetical protein